MANVPGGLKYSKTHEWVRIEGDTVTVGITDHAQAELGDIVYIDLPEVGRQVGAGDVFGEVESTKSVSELYAPLDGEIVAVNDAVSESPELINSDPYGEGWLIEIRVDDPSNLDALLEAEAYDALTKG